MSSDVALSIRRWTAYLLIMTAMTIYDKAPHPHPPWIYWLVSPLIVTAVWRVQR